MRIKTTTMLLTLMAFIRVTAQTRLLFDDDWTFIREGKSQSVDLPHDWDIYAAPDPKTGRTGAGGGWYPGGKGEYRKTFPTPEGELVILHFEGVYQKAEVYVNGKKAGEHDYGYTPFSIDITPYTGKVGKSNKVRVVVDNSEQPNCRWYSGSGIYRHVWLETMPAVHIAEDGIFVTTPQVSADKATVKTEVTIVNEAEEQRGAVLRVGNEQRSFNLAAGERRTETFIAEVRNPHLWSPKQPNLYATSISLNGKRQKPVKYGIRAFSFDAEQGFMLNGSKMLINGACVHHDDGLLGAMAFDDAEVRKVKLMKEAGFNLIRTSHNPASRKFIEACDSIGMLVIDEAFDGWRTAKNKYDYSTLIDSCYKSDIRAMVKRDRNSPSVIAWSIGNEVIERSDIAVITTARRLKKAVVECDNTRPVTEALCCWGNEDWESFDPHAEELDVVGYNYMMHKHASDHARDPHRIMWQTESYPRDAFINWANTNDNQYIVGDIVWTGLDYLGESGIGRWYYEGERPGEHYVQGGQPEWHGAYCGDVDMTGWRKPISHYRDILWNDTLGLYLAVKEPDGYRGKIKETLWSVWPTWESWNWEGWEGKPTEIEVYTRLPEVSLYLNDRLIGTKSVSRETEFKAVFSVPYERGTLRAEAGGRSQMLTTAGAPFSLRLTADSRQMRKGGQALSYLTVEVLDKDGNIVPEAEIECTAEVNGQGELLASGSANLKDTEPTTSPRFRTWKGRALIIVRSGKKEGSAEVRVHSTLPTTSLELQTK